MEDNDQELQIKQNFLKSEIIDKGIDPNKFLEYCVSIKENGDDINNWNFDDLKKCVADFNELLKKESQNEEQEAQNISNINNSISNSNSNSLQISSIHSQPQNLNQDNSQIIQKNSSNNKIFANQIYKTALSLNIIQVNNENFRKLIQTEMQDISLIYPNLNSNIPNKLEIKCKKAEKTNLNDKKIKVIIQNPKNSEKSLLFTQYTLYEVFTKEMDWLVQRRYSDFDWLRNILSKLYPRTFIPPMAKKKQGPKRFEQDFINKRMKSMQFFIDEIMENEELKTSEALVAFLSFNDRTQFEKKMKDLNNYVPSQYCEDLKTISGKINILNDDNNENYYININNYLNLKHQILSKLNSDFKNFYLNQTKACMDLDEVQKDFGTLELLGKKVKLSNGLNKTYEALTNFFEDFKNALYKKNVIIKEQIKHFFKREKNENAIFIDLFENRENLRQKYITEKNKLNAKKEKLYKINDINKWEIEDNYGKVDQARLMRDKNYAFEKMCTRNTQSLENIHKQLGYINFMNALQLQDKIEKNEKKLIENIKQFTEIFYPSINQEIAAWSPLHTYI